MAFPNPSSINARPYAPGLIPAARTWNPRPSGSSFIETVPSDRTPLSMSQPSVTPLGGFAGEALLGAGATATVYTTSRFAVEFLKRYASNLGLLQPTDELNQTLRRLDEAVFRRDQVEWDAAMVAFKKQHGIDIPQFMDGAGNVDSIESAGLRREAYLQAIQMASLQQPLHFPTGQAPSSSHLDPNNFNRLV